LLACFYILLHSQLHQTKQQTQLNPANPTDTGATADATKAPSFIDTLDKSSQSNTLADNEILLMRGPPDDFNRGTPRGLIIELRKALNKGDFKTATNFLDLTTVSAEVTGHKNDGLPTYRDRLTRIKTRQGEVDILLQHVPRDDGVYVWKISNATVAILPELYKQYGYGSIGEKLSEMFPGNAYLGLEPWQWIAHAGISALTIIFTWILTVLINIPILRKNLLHTTNICQRAVTFFNYCSNYKILF